MSSLVGILLVVIAGATVVGVLWMVMREQHVHEEYYIPPLRTTNHDTPGMTGQTSVREIVSETAGTEVQPPPTIERETQEGEKPEA